MWNPQNNRLDVACVNGCGRRSFVVQPSEQLAEREMQRLFGHVKTDWGWVCVDCARRARAMAAVAGL